jgi:hypothetical protein
MFDGDSGYNKRHHEFFKNWFFAHLTGGLSAALDVIAGEDMIPVTDFLHLLKDFCNKVKITELQYVQNCLRTFSLVKPLNPFWI